MRFNAGVGRQLSCNNGDNNVPKNAAKNWAQWAILLATVHCCAERAGKTKVLINNKQFWYNW